MERWQPAPLSVLLLLSGCGGGSSAPSPPAGVADPYAAFLAPYFDQGRQEPQLGHRGFLHLPAEDPSCGPLQGVVMNDKKANLGPHDLAEGLARIAPGRPPA